MNLYFGNYAMLIALAALAIPPLIHLLRRRRFQIVEWGAMQFLHMGQNKRRRLWIEELLLMLMRMSLIALIVMGLAAPFSETSVLAPLSGDQKREYVILIDGSASMALQMNEGKSPHRNAIEWVNDFSKTLKPGDRFSVYRVANQTADPVIEPTRDHERLARDMRDFAKPSGSADWPAALQSLFASKKESDRDALRDVVCITDGQRFGLTDDGKRSVWQAISDARQTLNEKSRPRLWFVDVRDQEQSQDAPNYSFGPIRTSRVVPWVGRTLEFTAELMQYGSKQSQKLPRVYWKLNGKMMGEASPILTQHDSNSNVEFSFRHKFQKKGPQVVSLVVEPDAKRDRLRIDNERHYALTVRDHLPVLLIDGDLNPGPKSSTYFIRNALAIASEPKRPPLMATNVVSYADWQPALSDKKNRPRVIILADVPRLSKIQQDALADFLADGGGVLVVLGPRAVAGREFYNRDLFDDGNGWLPGQLIKVAKEPIPAAFDTTRLSHRALELFRTSQTSTLGNARFPQWWQLKPAADSQKVAYLTTNDTLLMEGKHQMGRVLLCAVPLDRSWESNFTRVYEYPVFLHELVYYLADTRKTQWNIQPGQPIRLNLESSKTESATVILPDGAVKTISPKNGAVVWEKTNGTGVYRLKVGEQSHYFAVQPNVEESDLTRATEREHKNLKQLIGLEPLSEFSQLHENRITEKQDLWWLFFFGVLFFLCGEVWMTRRMARRGSH